jgi:hypothetical protein
MSEEAKLPPEKFKLSEMDEAYRATVIEVLKAGIVYKDLLGDFERRFTSETAGRYATYGSSLTMTAEQWKVVLVIAKKLNLNLT